MAYNYSWVGCSPYNYTIGRQGFTHIMINPHHAVMTSLSALDSLFWNPSRGASTHEGIGGKEVHGYVGENDTAWANGDWAANCQGYSFEMINSSTAYPYPIAEDTFDTAAERTADLLKYFGLGRAAYGTTIRLHRDFQATQCPGDWFVSNLDRFIDLVNQYYDGVIGMWEKQGDGRWKYKLSNGSYAVGWHQLQCAKGLKWFYFGSDGIMLEGWQRLSWSGGENWFYFTPDYGDMITGWLFTEWSGEESWFYFDGSGAMAMGWKQIQWSKGVSWFYFDAKGRMVKGWQKLEWRSKQSWYYFAESGNMLAGKQTIGDQIYLFNASGGLEDECEPIPDDWRPPVK